MFGRKRKLKSDAAAVGAPPVPSRTTINHNPVNLPMLAAIGVASVPLLVILAWWGLVYLAEAAGCEEPERDAATALIGLACLGFLFTIGAVIGRVFLSRLFEHREHMADINGQWRYKQLMAQRQPVGNSRTMGNDLRLARLIEMIMIEAYDHLEEFGQYEKNEAKPWAREQAKKKVLPGEREPVGWTIGAQVRSWLQDKEVLAGDTINIARFPHVGSVQEVLRLDFEMPIMVNGPQADMDRYKFIET